MSMVIKNVEVETATAYKQPAEDEDSRHSVGYDVLRLKIPLPGGEALYEVTLPPGMKANLEFAAQLSLKRS